MSIDHQHLTIKHTPVNTHSVANDISVPATAIRNQAHPNPDTINIAREWSAKKCQGTQVVCPRNCQYTHHTGASQHRKKANPNLDTAVSWREPPRCFFWGGGAGSDRLSPSRHAGLTIQNRKLARKTNGEGVAW